MDEKNSNADRISALLKQNDKILAFKIVAEYL